MEHCHRILDSSLGGYSLNRLDHNPFGLLVGGHFGLVHDFVDILRCVGLGLVFKRFDKLLLGFFG